ncbi:2,6-beta-fructan 6-levanbiohydrolase [Microbacterium laevaniformans]|uniref:glycoside hydrolase family 32 protein n=1 Tax=Microbacterium laevaniformans TaxID=36807 RepID=UPI00195EBF93|nr:glycoside hydrolase family 32 protein [Microbacterium laevaniformans]MBM7753655.1 levanbiose-producing levanase [Microbacterium laevaniformans]GLJ64212.1 levanbiose-producing levanase [Microbacterium laevaniformans]
MTNPTDPTRPTRSPRRTILVLLLAGIATVVVGVLVLMLSLSHRSAPAPTASPSGSSPADVRVFDRPAGWDPFRPSYHVTPPAHWMNDPQRPIFVDGLWHLYYLYNADYPTGNGTEWYHATSDDLVHWKNEGVAIEKYRNGLGDILTGSAVVDAAGTAGFGPGAVIAVVTQQDDGVQRQSVFGSTDGGYTFQPAPSNPVMENPGVVDWRDPKIIRDEASGRWVMVLAEGRRLGFYTSPDLLSWTYVSDFSSETLGLLECPDLFEMVDPDTGRRTWVLAASADGSDGGRIEGRSTGLAYWTGTWDGTRFAADDADPQWLDDGADFYAAVTWDDPTRSETDRLTERHALGWINNWAYARDLPTRDWQGGALSVTRSITLTEVDGRLRLRSRPVDALRTLEGDAESASAHVIAPGAIAPLALQPSSPAYRMRVSFERPDTGELRLRLGDSGADAVTVGYDADRGAAFIVREDSVAARFPEVYRAPQTDPSPPAADASARSGGADAEIVTMDILVDASSVEVFLGDGSSLTSAMYPVGSPRVTTEATGAAVRITALALSPMALAITD